MGARLIGRWVSAALVLAGTASASGCGGGDGQAGVAAGTSATGPAPVLSAPSAEPGAPAVEPAKDRVDRLTTRDLRKGGGRPAGRTSTVLMRFVAIDARSGAAVQSTYDEGAPFHVQLGAGLLPPGLERGVAGMREGGRRRIEIPREQARGKRALVYVVDLVRVL